MTETIRNRIIEAVVTKLGQALVSKGYQMSAGANVRLVDRKLSPEECPCFGVFPQVENVTQEYGMNVHDMSLTVEGLALHGDLNPSLVCERLLGDLIEAMTGVKWTLSVTSGGPYEPQVGETITGGTSGATGYIESITLSSGSWLAGDAVGTIVFRRGSGTFAASEKLAIGGNSDVATVVEAPTAQNPAATTAAGLADRISYLQGGVTTYPDAGEIVSGAMASFMIRYKTKVGNPYALG
jgi:hypothetical protein